MSSLRVCRLCFMCFFSAFHWKSHKVIIFLAVLWQSCLEILPQSDTKAFRQQRAWICYPSATELLKSVANHSLGSSGGPQSIRNLERGDHISKAGFDVAKWGVCLCFCSSWCWKHPPGFRQCRNDNTVWGVSRWGVTLWICLVPHRADLVGDLCLLLFVSLQMWRVPLAGIRVILEP